jgi:hypothetical protein
MAEEFKGLNKETLAAAIDIKNAMTELDVVTSSLNRRLQQSSAYLVNIKNEFNTIKSGANKVAEIQSKIVKSSVGTKIALTEQAKQLNTIKTLNIQIDNLYRAAFEETGEIKYNLEQQAKNLESARDNAQELAKNFGQLASDSAKLDKSTTWFSSLSEFTSKTPLLKSFSGPFEAAAEASRETVLNNAKNQTFLDEALKTGKGLTAEKIKELGLEKQAKGLTGAAAASIFKTTGATIKAQSAGMAGLQAGFKALGPMISKAFVPLAIIDLVAKAFKFIVDAMFTADERTTNIAKNLSISKDAAAGVYSNLTNLKGTLETELGTTKNIVEAFNDLAGITEFTTIATDKQIDAQIILTKELGLSKEAALGLQESFAVSNIEATKGVDIVYDQVAAFARQNGLIADGRKIFDQINKTSKLIQLNFKGNLPLLTKTTLEANKLGLSLEQVSKIAGSLLDFESSISAELEAELLTGKQLNLETARLYALNNDIAGLTQEIANQGINAANFASMNRIQQEAIAKTLGMQAFELGDVLYKQELIDKVAGNQIKKLREEAKILKESNNDRDVAKGLALEQQAIALTNAITSGKTLEQAQRSLTAQEKFNNALEQAQEIFSDLTTGGALDKLSDIIKGLADTLSKDFNPFTFLFDLSDNIQQQRVLSSRKTIKELGPRQDLNEIEKNKLQQARDYLKENNELGYSLYSSNSSQTLKNNTKTDINTNNDDIRILLKELVDTVKAGGNVYLDSNKVGTTMTMGTFKTQ